MIESRSFFPSLRPTFRASLRPAHLAASAAALTVALASALGSAQDAPGQNPTVPTPAPTTQTSADGSTTTTTSTTVDSTGKQVQSVSTSHTFSRGKKKPDAAKDDKVIASKDTKKNAKKQHQADSLIGVDAKLPDKQLFDKAQVAIKKGHFDVGRLDLQVMLNTYPDSQYQMRAKLAVADSWYKEGGTAALTQAEQEYRDFCIFFPNVPEAAEAQMRIGDIYFRQMDKPDRDYSKALHAEEEYRRMIPDYPDSKLVPDAKQRLREVQEVLAQRESDIAAFYATHNNYAAVIARYETVEETYPLYSHMDDTLIGLGDAYEAQARFWRASKLPEGPKAKLEQLYDDRAAEAYRKVVLEHAAAPHVEDAKDRLAALNLPIPNPTPEQLAASEALENSRRTYRITDRVRFLIMHEPDTVLTAQIGDPALTDPKPINAPAVLKRTSDDYTAAFKNGDAGDHAASTPAAADAASASDAAAANPAAPAAPAAPLAFTEVGTSESSGSSAAPLTAAPASSGPPSGSGVGVEIVSPEIRAATPETLPAATGKEDPNYGLKAVGPANATPLPAIEKAEAAPDRPNTITGVAPPAAAPSANGKKAKPPAFDKTDESSSKHKKKKGLKKLDPLPQ